jgi:hypothetical protein
MMADLTKATYLFVNSSSSPLLPPSDCTTHFRTSSKSRQVPFSQREVQLPTSQRAATITSENNTAAVTFFPSIFSFEIKLIWCRHSYFSFSKLNHPKSHLILNKHVELS